MKIIQNKGCLKGLEDVTIPIDAKDTFCDSCKKGKMTNISHKKIKSLRSTHPLEYIYTDLCGPMETSNGKKAYILTFIDDYTRRSFVDVIESKDAVFEKIKSFTAYAERSSGQKIKHILSDQGSEYINKDVTNFIREKGIKFQHSSAYQPQQNGIPERYNRSLLEIARTILIDADLPIKFWTYAIRCANYILNRTPHQSINFEVPISRWYENKEAPCVRHEKVWELSLLEETED